MKRTPLLILCGCLCFGTQSAFASSVKVQLPLPKATSIVGARSLAVSPDGKKLAFCYQGDIWVSDIDGGRAYPLTTNVEMDDYPVWSPDGEYIAFASNRYGSFDIFVTPSDGGESKRLTFASGSEIPTDWSPDGKKILFVTSRDDEHNGVYSVNVENGKTERYFLDMMSLSNPHFTPDGKSIVYGRLGFPWTRPRYHGSQGTQLWSYDLASSKRTPIAKNEFQHLWPNIGWNGKGVIAVTVDQLTPSSSPLSHFIPKNVDNVERTPNLYYYGGGAPKRLTNFVGFAGTRFLGVARNANVAAFEEGGDIYVLHANGEPKKISVRAPSDEKTTQEQHLVESTGASGATLSPKGDKVAFVLHNDVWMVPVEKGKGPNKDDATQLTDWEGIDYNPVWSPDNKTLFFLSDRDDTVRVFKMDTETKKVVAVSKNSAGDAFDVKLTPDGKNLCFLVSGSDGGLYMVPVDGGVPKRLIDNTKQEQRIMLIKSAGERAQAGSTYTWSPDGRYVAYVQQLTGSGLYYWNDSSNVVMMDTTTGKVTNLTELSATHGSPSFSPDGKYLFFVSDREGDGLYALPLKQEDARIQDLDLKYEKPSGTVTEAIDLQDIAGRSRSILAGAGIGKIEVDPNTGDLYYLQAGDIRKAAYNGDSPSAITTGGNVQSFEPSSDWSKLTIVQGGNIGLITLRRGGGGGAPRAAAPAATTPAGPGTPATPPTRPRRRPQNPAAAPVAPATPEPVNAAAVTPVTFRADYVVDLRKEHVAAFDQFWREYNQNYYDPNFHGRDWLVIKKHYEPMLASVGHRNEMAILLNEVVGEIESSHSEVSPAAGNPPAEATAHLGFLIDYSYAGPGIKVLEVPRGTPGSFAKTALKPGDIVSEINGTPVQLNEDMWKTLNGQVGRDVTLTVGAKKVTYRLLSGGEWAAIRHRDLIDARRAYVEEKSGGKLSYVQIPGMSAQTMTRFEQEVFQYSRGKKAVIIDVRNNGGGNTSDNILDILERYPRMYFRERDSIPVMAPGQMLNMPIVVMAAETSYSNAETFPAEMKGAHLATLVGMPTPGYNIWTGGLPLVDGTTARMPGAGSYRLDGSPLENNGVVPDYEVDITPEEFFAGKDPQLDKAIQVALSKIK